MSHLNADMPTFDVRNTGKHLTDYVFLAAQLQAVLDEANAIHILPTPRLFVENAAVALAAGASMNLHQTGAGQKHWVHAVSVWTSAAIKVQWIVDGIVKYSFKTVAGVTYDIPIPAQGMIDLNAIVLIQIKNNDAIVSDVNAGMLYTLTT